MEEKLKKGNHMTLSTRVNDTKAFTLLDNGSEPTLIDYSYAQRLKLPPFKLAKPIPLYLGNGQRYGDLTEATLIDLRIGNHNEQLLCYLAHIPRYQLVLGDSWLTEHNPYIHWKDRTITFSSQDCLSRGCLRHGRPHTAYATDSPLKYAIQAAQDTDVQIISAYAFYRLARRKDHDGFLMQPKDDQKYFNAATTNTVTSEDYDRFMTGKPSYSIDELKQRVPKKYHSMIDVFLKQDADKLRPHGPEDHEINLMEGATPPFARNYKPMTAQELQAVKKYLDENLTKGFIRPSSSPAAAPILLVRKPGGGIRVCVDYRALNEITIKNRYPIPRIDETLDRLSKAKIFSKFDIIHAFNRIRMKEGHEWLTAFNTRYGQYEYLVMPFGLCNAPGTFQGYINDTVREYLDTFCTAYVDDILVYSETEEEHTEHVLKVLQKLKERNLQLDIDKCEFDTKEVKYLGLVITTEGIRKDPTKVATIREWQTPESVKDVQSFVSFAGFYRRFIPRFSYRVRQLIECTRGTPFLSKSGKRKMKYAPLVWTQDCENAFQDIKKAFEEDILLAHFDPDKETWIETDASDFVTAGVLSQMHNGELRPVAFFSKKMSPAECNYMIYDKELLAIIRSFETWRPELASVDPENPVKVYTDHRNLEHFMTTKQLNRRQARWAEFLSEFNFKIMYRPGKNGQKPDILTRRSQDIPTDFDDDRAKHQFQKLIQDHQLDDDIKKALCAIWCANDTVTDPTPYDDSDSPDADSEGSSPLDFDASETSETNPTASDESPAEVLSLDELLEDAYSQDQVVQDIIAAKARGLRKLPQHILAKGIKLSMADLTVRDDRLWLGQRLYVPEHCALRLRIMDMNHRDRLAGHPGPKGMYRILLRNYFWPGMKDDCSQYADNCSVCKRAKARNVKKQGLLQPLPIPQHKWIDISMDYIEDLPICQRRGRAFKHVLVVVDRLTKARVYEPLESKGVGELVEVMHRRIFCVYGLPRSIVSDRGSSFVSYFWRRHCQRYGTSLKLSSAYHPETDGQTENANKTLKNYLRSYINYAQDDWVDWLPDAEFAVNNFVNQSTGMTPFFANSGYHPRTGAEPPGTYEAASNAEMETADKIVERTEEIRTWLQDQLAWAQEEYERYANAHRQPHPEYRVGDEVYVDARHFAAKRESKSLGYKNAGPWPITRVIDNKAYELALPDHMIAAGICPVFHPWKLHLAPKNPYPGQNPEPQPPILITGPGGDDPHEEWDVLDIVDCRKTKRYGIQYKARFIGNWDEWNANPPWQPWTDFKNAKDKVLQFHRDHPKKPAPPEIFLPNTDIDDKLTNSDTTSRGPRHRGGGG
jgi:reverse transcriptase-like protein/integrase-like protein